VATVLLMCDCLVTEMPEEEEEEGDEDEGMD
jgi:hypothetical protein